MSANPAVVETTPAATPKPELVAAFNTAKANMSTPAPEAKPEVKTEAADPSVRQPYQPPEQTVKKEAAPSLDWNALSEDERKNGYLRQQDYTKKTQEIAEQRRVQEAEFAARREEFERYAKLLTEQRPPVQQTADPNAPQDPMARIQALRDEGNYAEADRLLLQTVQTLAEQQVEPIKKAAQVQELQATFRNVTQEAMAQPLVNHYAKEVAQVFDSNAPVVQEFRQFALSSPERMKAMIPAFTYLLACEQDMKALRANQKQAIEEGIKKGIDERRTAANRVPGKVVESANTSRETATGKMSLLDSFKFAQGQVNE